MINCNSYYQSVTKYQHNWGCKSLQKHFDKTFDSDIQNIVILKVFGKEFSTLMNQLGG